MTKTFITDFEVLSPFGGPLNQFSESMFEGRSAITEIGNVYGEEFSVGAAGLIPGLERKFNPNPVALGLIRQLLRRNVEKTLDGILFFIPEEDELAGSRKVQSSEQQASNISELVFTETGHFVRPEEIISIHEACVSGISGLSMAAQRIRAGIWRRALVVGVDLRCSPLDLLRFRALGALSTRPVSATQASCPFSKDRDGFVKAQGAGAFILEAEDALNRGQSVWGEIRGFAQTSDAWRLTEGRPDCLGATRAMEAAIKMSGLELGDISCISAHATSTKLGDALEARAIEKIWRERARKIPVTALKSQIGHAGQAAGLLQVAAALLMIKHQRVAPTINFSEPDPGCPIDCVPNAARHGNVDWVLCNAFAFGGQNASMVLGKHDLA
ncbi:MAG: beta-ketoacyl-[acyl-carrier-protein] synthase family protein [Bdellovibrionota bacterium]